MRTKPQSSSSCASVFWKAIMAVFAVAIAGYVHAVGLAAEGAGDPHDQIRTLRAEIARHDELYHRKAAPEISDADYDDLKRRLVELEQRFPAAAQAAPPRTEIGDDRSGLFRTQRHRMPMLSLEKAYAEQDARRFHARLAKALARDDLDYLVEPKVDGLAVSVTFKKGKLVLAVTRGNGEEGDDITANVLQIEGMPRELAAPSEGVPDFIELRGEIFVPFAEFQRVNFERELVGEARFATPRALAAGSVRQIDSSIVGRRGLRVVFFGMGACEPATLIPPTQRDFYARLKSWGVPVLAHVSPARGGDELVRALNLVESRRGGFEFPTDGAVVKLDVLAQQRQVGSGETSPRWAIAYKFAPDRVETEVRAITLQVGRTGVLTPVAELAPVRLGGVTVSRATLHNREEIARKDIRVGDFVGLERAGDVIPAVTNVILPRRPPSATSYVFPAACPECQTALEQRVSEAVVRCPNGACPAQVRRRLEHFASSACVAISGLGPAVIDALVECGLARSISDLYRLSRTELMTTAQMTERTADRLLAAIEASKHADLWRILYGIGIPHVGATTARDLARQCSTLAGVLEHGGSVVSALAEPRYRSLITELLALGVGTPREITSLTTAVTGGRPVAGKTFVLTGTLPTLTRAQATSKIQAAGGRVVSGVTKSTHYLVAGAEPGAKATRARKLGVLIIGEPELLRLISATKSEKD